MILYFRTRVFPSLAALMLMMNFADASNSNQMSSDANPVHLPSNFYRLAGPQLVQQMPVEVLDPSPAAVGFRFTNPPIVISESELDGIHYSTVRMDGEGSMEEPGVPDVPRVSRLVIIESTGSYSVDVTDFSFTESALPHPIYPVQPLDEANGNLDSGVWPANAEIYSNDSWYPPEIAVISSPATLRDIRFVVVTVYPVQVNPVTGQMRTYDRIDAEIYNMGGTGENELTHNPQFVSPSFKRLYETFENFHGSSLDELPEQPGKHIFICDPNATVVNEVQKLVTWRKKKGADAELVTTSTTGTSAANINSYIETQYTNSNGSLEFVTLVGEPDAASPYLLNTDNTHLDNLFGANGNVSLDPVPDISIGRLPATSQGELAAMVANIIKYESDPYMTETAWFDRTWCVSHTAQVPSNPSTKEYTRQIMLQHGISDVEWTVFGGGMNQGTLETIVDEGICVLNNRMSWVGEFSSGQLSGLANGNKLPFVMVITCGTGSFAFGDALSEDWVRLGTTGTPRGAIGCVGLSGVSTHAKYNNIVDGGAMQTLFALDIREQGTVLVGAKLELYKNYWSTPGGGDQSSVINFSAWANLMGDPAVPIRLNVPEEPTVFFSPTIPRNSNNVSVEVQINGNQAEHALVSLVKGTETFARGYTDSNGMIELLVSTPTLGYMSLVVSNKDWKPFIDSIQVIDELTSLTFNSVTIDDDNIGGTVGDGNGILNPGETIDLNISIRNTGTSNTAVGVNGALVTPHAGIDIVSGASMYPNIPINTNASPNNIFRIEVGAVFDEEPVPFFLNLSWVGGSSAVRLDLVPEAADISFVSSAYIDGNNHLDPGETGDLTVTIQNSGNRSLSSSSGILRSLDSHVIVNDSLGNYGNVNAGANSTNSGDHYNVSALISTAGGYQAAMQLVVIDNNGVRDSTNFIQIVGVALSTSPTGPDAYGYYAYDNTELQPSGSNSTYEWTEIVPGLGGPGSSLGFTDGGEDQDDVNSYALPFDFVFYGQTFDSITICSNGWVAFGVYPNIDYRNWHMGSPLGPPNMVAAFWDDLKVTGITNGGVYTWYDDGSERFIVEWRTRTMWSNQDEVFQVILYDPSAYPSPTGDGKILVQYQTFTLTTNQVGFDNDYASVGIQNHNHTQGLEVCYWNLYTPGSSTLANGRSYMFTTDITGAINPTFSLLSPNGGQVLFVDSLTSIIWQPGGVTGNIKIEISRNSLGGPWTELTGSTANDGLYTWTVTDPTSSSCRVSVTSLNTPDSTDASATDFSIARVITQLSENFEGGAADWTHSAGAGWSDQWHISTERFNSGTHSYKCGSTGTGTHANLLDARLESPLINNLLPDARLTYYHQIEGELSGAFPDSAYDGGLLEISVDGGVFVSIEPSEGYPKTFRNVSGGGNPYTGPMPGRECFAGTITAWVQETVDLSAFAGSDIRIRYRFGSDAGTALEGWYVDDVQVFGVATDVVPTIPLQVTIYQDGINLVLRWDDDDNTSYRIYESSNSGGPFVTLTGTSATNSFTVPGGASAEKKYYVVVGWDGN